MDLQHLLHLQSIRRGDFREIPDGVPICYGTMQAYGAVLDAILAGQSFLVADRRGVAPYGITGGPWPAPVHYTGLTTSELFRRLLMRDELFRAVFGRTDFYDVVWHLHVDFSGAISREAAYRAGMLLKSALRRNPSSPNSDERIKTEVNALCAISTFRTPNLSHTAAA